MTDLISRSAVIERLETLRWNYTLKAGYREAMTDAIGEVRSASTLDAAPVVHARWIREESPFAEYEEAHDGESHDRYVCSRCRCEAGFGCDADGFATDQNLDDWCSNCGARMDGYADG